MSNKFYKYGFFTLLFYIFLSSLLEIFNLHEIINSNSSSRRLRFALNSPISIKVHLNSSNSELTSSDANLTSKPNTSLQLPLIDPKQDPKLEAYFYKKFQLADKLKHINLQNNLWDAEFKQFLEQYKCDFGNPIYHSFIWEKDIQDLEQLNLTNYFFEYLSLDKNLVLDQKSWEYFFEFRKRHSIPEYLEAFRDYEFNQDIDSFPDVEEEFSTLEAPRNKTYDYLPCTQKIIILIKSSLSNYKARNAARNSWIRDLNASTIKDIFLNTIGAKTKKTVRKNHSSTQNIPLFHNLPQMTSATTSS